jgi:Ca-activated chloride channel homolog
MAPTEAKILLASMTAFPARRVFLRQIGLASAGLMARGAPLLAQADRQIFRSDVELVTTAVTVIGADGRLVADLEKSDFEIFDDGLEQAVAQFTKERVPVSVALLLDSSDSMFGQRMKDARAALAEFVENLLAPTDEMELMVFNHEPRLTTQWTMDRTRVGTQLAAVQPSGGTAAFDAIRSAIPTFDARNHPRAAIVLISDGADTASDISIPNLQAIVGPSDVFIYAIAVQSSNARIADQGNPYALQDVTSRSGGYTEVVASAADIGAATARIADELNKQYMLGFTPTRRPDGKYHTIRVRVKGDGYRVRSRRGYISGGRRS